MTAQTVKMSDVEFLEKFSGPGQLHTPLKQFAPKPKGRAVWAPWFLRYGDYSGSPVTMSNHHAFLDRFQEVEGVRVNEGHNYRMILIDRRALEGPRGVAVQKFLKELKDYCYDSKHLSRLEFDLYLERWNDLGGCESFLRRLSYWAVEQNDPEAESAIELLRECRAPVLRALYETLLGANSRHYEFTYCQCSLYVSKVANGLTKDKLMEALQVLGLI